MLLKWMVALLGLWVALNAQAAFILRAKRPSPVTSSALPPGWRSPEEVQQTILTFQVGSVEDLLNILTPEMFAKPVLLVNSLSRQAASFTEPRVILSHPNGRFFLSFNGGNQQPGGHKIEMIHFNEKENVFDFSEVNFEGGSAHFASKDELTRCLACHASSPSTTALAHRQGHPIWDSYPDWPDAFGNSHRLGGSGTLPLSPQIEQAWLNFQKTAPNHSRYRHLGLDRVDRSDLDVFSARLGDQIMHMTLFKLAREIKEQKHYTEFAEAFAHLNVFTNSDFSAYLPNQIQDEFRREIGGIVARIKKGIDAYIRAKANRFDNVSGLENATAVNTNNLPHKSSVADFDSRYTVTKARLYFLLIKIGLSPELTNLTLEKYSYSNVQATVTTERLSQYLATDTDCEKLLKLAH